VNGVTLMGCTHSEAVNMLRHGVNTAGEEVMMLICKGFNDLSASPADVTSVIEEPLVLSSPPRTELVVY